MSRFRMTEDRHHLVTDNMRLISVYFRKFPLDSCMNKEEATAEALALLCHAASRFDESLGFKFSTYAINCINLGMLTWRSRVSRMMQGDTVVTHIKTSRGGEDQSSMTLDMIADKSRDVEELIENHELVDRLLVRLHEPDRSVIEMRFGVGRYRGIEHSLGQVGEHFGLSKERIRQIQVFALRRLLQIVQGKPATARCRAKSPKSRGLGPVASKVMEFIEWSILTTGTVPTMSQMAKRLGISTRSMREHVKRLCESKHLANDNTNGIAILRPNWRADCSHQPLAEKVTT